MNKQSIKSSVLQDICCQRCHYIPVIAKECQKCQLISCSHCIHHYNGICKCNNTKFNDKIHKSFTNNFDKLLFACPNRGCEKIDLTYDGFERHLLKEC